MEVQEGLITFEIGHLANGRGGKGDRRRFRQGIRPQRRNPKGFRFAKVANPCQSQRSLQRLPREKPSTDWIGDWAGKCQFTLQEPRISGQMCGFCFLYSHPLEFPKFQTQKGQMPHRRLVSLDKYSAKLNPRVRPNPPTAEGLIPRDLHQPI